MGNPEECGCSDRRGGERRREEGPPPSPPRDPRGPGAPRSPPSPLAPSGCPLPPRPRRASLALAVSPARSHFSLFFLLCLPLVFLFLNPFFISTSFLFLFCLFSSSLAPCLDLDLRVRPCSSVLGTLLVPLCVCVWGFFSVPLARALLGWLIAMIMPGLGRLSRPFSCLFGEAGKRAQGCGQSLHI